MKKVLIKVFFYVISGVCIFNMLYLRIQYTNMQQTIAQQEEQIENYKSKLNTLQYNCGIMVDEF